MKAKVTPWGRGPRKRETRFPEKKEAVLTAAATLFRQKGFEGASLNDLADILNITKPTIYYYVESKELLFLEIIRAAQDEILEFMRESEHDPGTGRDKLRRMMIHYGLLMISDPGACLVRIPITTFEPASRAEVARHIDEADKIIYRVLESGRRDGSLNFSNPTVTLHALFGSLNWLAYWGKAQGRLTPEALVAEHVETLLTGITASPKQGELTGKAKVDLRGARDVVPKTRKSRSEK